LKYAQKRFKAKPKLIYNQTWYLKQFLYFLVNSTYQNFLKLQ